MKEKGIFEHGRQDLISYGGRTSSTLGQQFVWYIFSPLITLLFLFHFRHSVDRKPGYRTWRMGICIMMTGRCSRPGLDKGTMTFLKGRTSHNNGCGLLYIFFLYAERYNTSDTLARYIEPLSAFKFLSFAIVHVIGLFAT